MNLSFIKQDNNSHLLLIMAGWGMDAVPFSTLDSPGYDIAVTWDYTDESLDTSCLNGYREVIVIAWSMGVMECARIIPSTGLPVSLTVAVNGSTTPVSDNTGIPVAVFNGTLDSLTEATLAKFNRRMCGSGDRYRKFQEQAPQRSIDSLSEELRVLGERASGISTAASFNWDIAVIGKRDMIFPANNLQNAWNGTTTIEIDEPHLPDFQAIINRLVVNKNRVATRFSETRDTYDSAARPQYEAARLLAAKLIEQISPESIIETAIEIGAGSGQLTSLYSSTLNIRDLELWDLTIPLHRKTSDYITYIADDAEARLFEVPTGSIDLIVSASTLQWFNSPCNALRQIERSLRPGGTAAITLYTTGTYESLSRETDISINYVAPERLRRAIPENCDILYFDTDKQTETFDSTRQLINHTRITGVNATGGTSTATLRKILTENKLRQLEYNSTTIIFRKR